MYGATASVRGISFSCLVAFLCWATPGWAETPTSTDDSDEGGALVTDRPDFTESSATVPPTRLQLEMGTQYRSGETESSFVPANVLARYGVARSVEVRAAVTPAVAEFSADRAGDWRGLGEVELGAKLAGSVAEGARVGVIPWASLSDPVGAPGYATGAIGTVALDGTGPVSLAANLGAGWTTPANGPSGVTASGSIATGIALPAQFGTYLETYGIYGPSREMNLFADAGVTYLLNRTLQLDGFVAAGIPEFESIAGGLGVSFLL